MRANAKWILGGVAALAIAGAIYAGPVLAANGYGMMGATGSGNGGHGMMSGSMMGGDMMAMHNVMMPLMSQMPAMHSEMMGEVGKLLGLTEEELTQAMANGKTLLDIAAEKNVAPGEIRSTMTRGMKAFLDRLTAEGAITEAQVGQMLGFMEKNLESCLSGNMSEMMSMMSGHHPR